MNPPTRVIDVKQACKAYGTGESEVPGLVAVRRETRPTDESPLLLEVLERE